MINARAIATLGIGFGALAISTLGFTVETQPQEQPRRLLKRLYPTKPPIDLTEIRRKQDEELILMMAAL